VAYSGLFLTSDTTPPAAGVCDQQCDPFADNDWDGVMGPYTRTGTTCREDEGCYGFPDRGTVPKTAFSCTRDVNAMKQQPTGLRHRVQCLEGDPADPSKPRCRTAAGVYPNGCNQGYEPILHESSTTTTAVCLAMCEPLDCYAGSCGTADDARFGKSPNRCNALDRVGEFNGDLNTTPHPNGDTCQRLWRQEVDMSGHFEISDRGDTLGFCIDNSKYQYDSDGDNMVDMVLPPCGALQKLGTHMDTDKTNPTVYWGAADFGCVPHADAGLFNGKGTVPAATMRVWNSMDTWRLPYNAMATPD
jgi:hypothetical protein